MAAKILCYPDSNDTWTFMNKGNRCDCGSNCFHYKSVGGVIGAYCNACESLYVVENNTLEEKRKEIEVLKTAIGFSVGMIRNGHFYTTKNEYHASHAEDIDACRRLAFSELVNIRYEADEAVVSLAEKGISFMENIYDCKIHVVKCIQDANGFHRILDYGGSESDVKSILGAVKLSKKELKEKSFFFELDDGYVMPGLVKLLK